MNKEENPNSITVESVAETNEKNQQIYIVNSNPDISYELKSNIDVTLRTKEKTIMI